ncbi:extracellular solute-binding protein [Bacillus lacus]|uniref:Extracellular solute-binding protein n=1 Tax=Metabacillus lacus TaxID=1983721 RepID=A0A7X2IVX1_9BACI|nr:extracellular solute-binding protein [Metabacillus lacus]MRX70773.1 extracellular solute-binding protein [Metabacillus lacus]
MKKGLLFALILLVGTMLGACSSQNTNAGEGGEEKTITFIHWRGEDAEVFKQLISKFEEENPGLKVKMNIYPSEQYPVQTLLRESSTDVFASTPGSQFEMLKKAGFYEDLTGESFVDLFNEKLIEVGNVENQQLALPYQLVYNQPVYNADIFEELGLEPAKDWEGFLALCETLKENGYIPIAFPGADIGPGQFMNSMVMNNAQDEEIFTKLMNGEAQLTEEWWIKTLSQFQELYKNGYISKDALGTKHDGAIAQVAQERAAMLATGSYAMANIKNLNPDINLKMLAPITVSESEAAYEGVHTTTFMLGLNTNSERKEEGKKFIEFLAQKENAEIYANETGQFLTISDIEYESDELKNSIDWMEKKTRFQPRYMIPNLDVEKAVLGSIQSVIGGESPEKAAEEAQKIVNQNISQ